MINRKCHQLHRSCRHTVCHTVLQVPWGNRKVARAWRGRGAGHRHFFWLGWRGRGAGMARAWRGHFLSPLPGTTLCMVHGDSRSGQTHVSACDRPQNSKSEAPKRESTARGTIVHTQLAALQRGPRRCAAPPPHLPRRVRLGDGPDHGEREKSRAITGTVFFSRATMVFHRGHNQTYQITGNHGNFTGTITGTITGSPNHYTGRELFFKLIIWNTPQFGVTPSSKGVNGRKTRGGGRTRPGRICFFKLHRVGRVRDASAAVLPDLLEGIHVICPRLSHTLSISPQWGKDGVYPTFWGFEKMGRLEKKEKMENPPHFPRPGRRGPARPGRPRRAGRAGRAGLWRGTREVAPKAPRLAPKAPPSAPKSQK
eukprot:gene12264-biopygen10978